MAANNADSLPFHLQFAAGAVAGVSEIMLMYPLDVVKTRFQLQVKGQPGAYSGMVDCVRTIIAKEGVSRLYRGIIPPILMEAPKRATKFAANEKWGELYKRQLGVSTVQGPLAVITGASAGATEALVVVPFELIKIRLQDHKSAALYNGTLDCVRKVVFNEGILALYQGLEATMWRHIWWNAGYFGCISGVRQNLPKAATKQAELTNNFIAGSIGGTVGTILNTPFDVVKSRIQNSPRLEGQLPKYNWSFPALGVIMREEGFTALYKGFTPKVLRLGPGGGILLVVFDQVTQFFKKMRAT